MRIPSSPPDSDRTRILFICHDGQIYGAQNSLRLLVENLPREKYEVFVSFSRKGPLVDVFDAMSNVTVLFHDRIQGAKHSSRNWFRRFGDLGAMFLNMGRVLPLVRIMQQYHIDIVHTNSLVSLEGAIAAKMAGVPHFWHIREPFMEYNPRFYLTLGRSLTRAMVHHFSTQVLCISSYVCQQFTPYCQTHPGRYHVLHNAIECPTEWQAVEQADKPYLNLAYMGRVSDGKRFQDVLAAFVQLKKQWQDAMPFRLKVYGDFICPRFEAQVRQSIAQHQLEEDLQLMGYCKHLDTCLGEVDLLLMPSSTEAFGRTLLEAMVRGIPVLTARSGAPLEVVEDGISGFFHNPNDPDDVAACLNRIWENRHQLAHMSPQCVERVRQKFDLTHQITQLDALYQQILQRRNANAQATQRPCWHGS